MPFVPCPDCDRQLRVDFLAPEQLVRCPACDRWCKADSSGTPADATTPSPIVPTLSVGVPPAEPRHEMARIDTTEEKDSDQLAGDDKLFESLMNGSTVTAAAYLAGMSRRTAYRRLADPGFREQLEEARGAVRDNMMQRLVDASGAAIDRLWNLLDHEDEYLRIRVASTLLDSMAKVQKVMLQYADTVQETCQLRQHEQEPSSRGVLTRKTTKTTRVS